LADQKATPGSSGALRGGAPHYYLPPRSFDPCCIPDVESYANISLMYFKLKRPYHFWMIF
jgi:hypothetical protein